VYILRSLKDPSQWYTGRTIDLRCRMREHNRGKCASTKRYLPWEIVAYFAFKDVVIANRFERYLKTGSGREFARRHFRA
jgi:predicted GIY-YIG superfamily endonuclease